VKPWTRLRKREGSLESVLERLSAVEDAVQENRRLNQRLADVIDVVTEVLVPAADRDDERMQQALAELNKTLGDDAPRA
jgi:hypothetical protein